ncbi:MULTISPECIES: CidA/LrgA family protein [unclassified Fusibacter]|uniref:CidA/LrgA family protein n=1 Tax=unclassified Fusibacter TaxID=2624464 RepID=UPI00101232E8|nr:MULTISPECIES: CidA/LrgA family protein [unclassified Fusibacter]MCK8058442.1 CidA/LrgA family protein [Fusibacter sp. A2]NPE22790.1 CidA/LrgA family protein [Fusibacter sp. A1]RXV60346.1 CidA/LrgA family protein [Fusibacter sp. A1]
MKILRQLCIILGICILGELISSSLPFPIPGNILGMIIMLMLLTSKIVKKQQVEDVAEFLLSHLAVFFIPAGVGLINVTNIIGKDLLSIISIIILSTIIVMATTGLAVQFLQRVVARNGN